MRRIAWGRKVSSEMNCTDIAPRHRLKTSRIDNPGAIILRLEQAGVAEFYPGFRNWFFTKVVPGLRTGERCILSHEIEGRLAGIAICKRTNIERKLCTLWVDSLLRDRGIAGKLAYRAFDWLECDQPLFTVPEERMSEFAGLLKSWNFPEPIACESCYRPGRSEFIFNGSPRQLVSL